MAKVSVLIPTRNEMFLSKTVDDIFNKARGEFEVVVYLDGYFPDPPLREREGLKIVHCPEAKGMRPGINAAAAAATGKYLMKLDAHCMMDEGFDVKLQADMEDNWVVVPRRYSLEPEDWKIKETGKAPVDYHYLCWPWNKPEEAGMHGEVWRERAKKRLDILIDDEMSSQGSCWFMTKDHFDNFLEGLPNEGYGNFVQEFQQIGNKTWLGGGEVKVNKKTWYAHLHKGKTYGRGYFISKPKMVDGQTWSYKYWMENRWEKRVHDIEWLIDKFWPVPTWPENWKSLPQVNK